MILGNIHHTWTVENCLTITKASTSFFWCVDRYLDEWLNGWIESHEKSIISTNRSIKWNIEFIAILNACKCNLKTRNLKKVYNILWYENVKHVYSNTKKTFRTSFINIKIQGVLKRYVKNLRRYSSHLKDEKMLYGHRCRNAYFRSYVENTVSCITYTRKNLGLIIVDDNRLIRLIYIWS